MSELPPRPDNPPGPVQLRLDAMAPLALREALLRCCGSHRWVEEMVRRHPYGTPKGLRAATEAAFAALQQSDWLEAFSHHPRIGDVHALREKFAKTADWAGKEQAGASAANEATLQALADGNRAYADKYGFIFIICATGKSATEMLTHLQERLANTRDQELRTASGEQEKITALRLDKLQAD